MEPKIEKTTMNNSRIFLLTVGISLFLSLFMHIRLREYAFDDAYIHFRIANNLVETGKPYFNQGEVVNVSSSMGWTLMVSVLAALARLRLLEARLPLLVATFNAFTLCAGAATYTLLFYRLSQGKRSISIYLAFYWLYIALCLPVSLTLMETASGLFIAGLAFFFLLENKKIALTFFGIAIFFRPEFVVPAGLVLLYIICSKKFTRSEVIANLAIGVIPFLLFELYYFGSIIPNSIIAKSIIYNPSTLGVLSEIFSYLQTTLYFLSLQKEILSTLSLFYVIYLPSVLIVFYFFHLKNSINNHKLTDYEWVILIISTWGILLFSLYLLSGTKIFAWYIPLFTVPLLITCCYQIINAPSRLIYRIFLVFSAPMFIIQGMVILLIAYSAMINPAYAPGFSEGARAKQYIDVGRKLYSQYPNAALLTSEIGGLGYGFKGRIIDGAGLASPEILDLYKKESAPEGEFHGFWGALRTDIIEWQNPEIIVVYDFFVQDFLQNENLIQGYSLTRQPVFLEEDRAFSEIKLLGGVKFYRSLWHAMELLIFVRNDIYQ